jgi:hypothetical protein
MECLNCHFDGDSRNTYCPNCGQKPHQPVQCPTCHQVGRVIAQDYWVCQHCGEKLSLEKVSDLQPKVLSRLTDLQPTAMAGVNERVEERPVPSQANEKTLETREEGSSPASNSLSGVTVSPAVGVEPGAKRDPLVGHDIDSKYADPNKVYLAKVSLAKEEIDPKYVDPNKVYLAKVSLAGEEGKKDQRKKTWSEVYQDQIANPLIGGVGALFLLLGIIFVFSPIIGGIRSNVGDGNWELYNGFFKSILDEFFPQGFGFVQTFGNWSPGGILTPVLSLIIVLGFVNLILVVLVGWLSLLAFRKDKKIKVKAIEVLLWFYFAVNCLLLLILGYSGVALTGAVVLSVVYLGILYLHRLIVDYDNVLPITTLKRGIYLVGVIILIVCLLAPYGVGLVEVSDGALSFPRFTTYRINHAMLTNIIDGKGKLFPIRTVFWVFAFIQCLLTFLYLALLLNHKYKSTQVLGWLILGLSIISMILYGVNSDSAFILASFVIGPGPLFFAIFLLVLNIGSIVLHQRELSHRIEWTLV